MKKKEFEEKIYPIIWKDKKWYYEDCDDIFRMMYEFEMQLNSECGIYLTEGRCMYPDGTTGEY